ncbi:MAG: class I poly(R)-hydroxyalkanoic acid synthase [Deltaproteobacteria bacterium]|nr:class I poly(R)-hydroxyalkanoic acid synthase [Deltaproteobacteria bacterium]
MTTSTEQADPVLARMGALAAQSQRIVAMVLARQAGAAGILQADPLKLGGALARFGAALARHPVKVARSQWHLARDTASLTVNAARRVLGRPVTPVVEPAKGDRRFKDAAWSDNAWFDFLKQAHLLGHRFAGELVDAAAELSEADALKVEFYARQFMDALSPSNFPWSNPEVLRATRESHGENLLRGLENLLRDLEAGQGSLRIRVTDENAFKVGGNLAVTPGKVVWRNELCELIHYAPLTETQHATPLLFIPPWINKFYILDLRPENSLVRWLLGQGFNVFLLSWVNPDERHAQKGYGDYLKDGPLTALEVIRTITGKERVHAVGYCLGGTLLATLAAHLAARGDERLASTSYFTTLTDFSAVGELGMFVEPAVVDQVEQKMRARGYLKGEEMQFPFNLMRSNDLIWSHVVNNYLLGRSPFPFDMLYWASDSTRMPAEMHAFYLRNMYVENKLVKPGGLVVLGTPLDLRNVRVPTFMVSTREDHIAPWKATYKATQLFSGPVAFHLAGSGHIAGIINPPTQVKYGFVTAEVNPPDPDAFLAAARETAGSWWPTWAQWLTSHGDEQVPAAPPGGGKVPLLGDAPGSYAPVREADLKQAW